MNIEKELQEMDFSQLSKIKDSLFEDLMAERAKRFNRVELDEEELEFLAAAGNNFQAKNDDKKLK